MSVNPIDDTGIAAKEYDEIETRMRGRGGGFAQAILNYVILAGSASISLAIWGDSYSSSNARAICALIAFPVLVATGYFLQLMLLRGMDESDATPNLDSNERQVLKVAVTILVSTHTTKRQSRSNEQHITLALAPVSLTSSMAEKIGRAYRETHESSADAELAAHTERLSTSVRERGDVPCRIDQCVGVGPGYTLLSLQETNDSLNNTEEFWCRFFEHFPRSLGIVYLSRVGLDSSATKALVYFWILRGPARRSLYGYSFLCLDHGDWAVRKCEVR